MAKQNQAADTKSEKKRRPQVEPVAVAEPSGELAGLAVLPGGPLAAAGDGTIQGQSARLDDPRLHSAQRQALAAQIGLVQGNGHLRRVIAQAGRRTRAAGNTKSSPQADISRDSVSPVRGAVQRQPEEGAQNTLTVVGIIDGTAISTYRDLYHVYRRLLKNLIKEKTKLGREGAHTPLKVRAVIRVGTENSNTLANVAEGEQIDEVTYGEGVQWYDQYRDALDKIEDVRIWKSVQNMRKGREASEKALESVKAALEKIRDAQNKAYMAEDTELGAKILDYAFKANGLAESLVTAKQGIHGAESELSNMMGQGLKCPKSVKYLSVFRLVDKASKVYSLYSNSADLLSEGKTGMAKSIKSIKSVVAIAGATSSLIKTSNGLNLALSPLQEAIMEKALQALAKLIEVARHINRDMIERGEYHLVNWELEPGGRPLFDFMMQVMAAGSAADIPVPVPSAVSDYMVGNQSDIEEAAAGGEEMPTSGWLWWEEVDNAAIAKWVFKHRENLWAIFYGSTKPGSNT